jgi:NAD-dependent dihydropyrimidine dehydrogenase PreA subunit
MAKRKIIKIDENKCNGCGLCIPNCPEGAIQIIDGKARLISDLFCDGLGACIGHCPEGAITIEEREAKSYDERKVIKNIVKQGKNVILAHLAHLKSHAQHQYLKEALEFLKEKNIAIPEQEIFTGHKHESASCPGAKIMDFREKKEAAGESLPNLKAASQLRQWPVQINLVPPFAPYLEGADLLVAADCVPFAYADFHQDLLKNKILLVGCPKFDDLKAYQEKFKQIFKENHPKSITYAHMEVPCCFGLIGIIKQAIAESGKTIPFKEVTINIKGERLN